jgi:uncharacterized membrane protein HdeD (DUF308 family)
MFFSRWWLITLTVLALALRFIASELNPHSTLRLIARIAGVWMALMAFTPLVIALVRAKRIGKNSPDNIKFLNEWSGYIAFAALLIVDMAEFVQGYIGVGVLLGILLVFFAALIIASWKRQKKEQTEP